MKPYQSMCNYIASSNVGQYWSGFFILFSQMKSWDKDLSIYGLIVISAWCWLGCGLFVAISAWLWLIFSKICIKQKRKNNFASFRAVEIYEKAYLLQNLCRNFEWNRCPHNKDVSWVQYCGLFSGLYFWFVVKCGKNKIKEAWAPFKCVTLRVTYLSGDVR